MSFPRSVVRGATICALLLITICPASAKAPRVLPPGKQPADRRLEPLKDLNGYFPFEPAATPADWQRRAARLRRQMLVAVGLSPMPTQTPLNAVVHGRIERDDYTVEKAFFESFPGFYVTGNLYRPKDEPGKRPGVLCPHGHWANGRFYDQGEGGVRREIQQEAEQFAEGGRSPLQARCVHLARMGCVVFHYDMIGYADSTQISFEVAHRFAKQREEMNRAENWGLYSPQAESHLQSIMGLQTYNSIRALDFLASLDDVDPQRLAVTGASGGGTQTFMIAAVDPRPAVAMPCVMVSTAMQGGCTCENCCLLRTRAGNVEIAALFAPKPLGLTAANDWTKEMATKGFPQLKEHYKMLGAPDNVMLSNRIEFGHNYNAVSRRAMYEWFNKHLGLKADVAERDYRRLTKKDMTVWNESHPRPKGGPDFERKLLRWWTEDSQKQLAALTPTDKSSLDRFRDVVGGAADAIIGRRLPDAADLDYDQTRKKEIDNYIEIVGLLRNTPHGEELPVLFLYPKNWEGQVVIWIHAEGKSGILKADGSPQGEVQRLIDNDVCVVGVDLFLQGEFLMDGTPPKKTRRVTNPRESAAYTFGYNPSLFARRVHDILSVITFVRNHELEPKQVHLVGLQGAGAWVAAARAQARDVVDRAAIDTDGFRIGKVTRLASLDFLPGGAKYFDLPGFLALSAPSELWLAGEGKAPPPIVLAAYQAAGADKKLIASHIAADKRTAAAVDWLLAGE